TYRQPVCPHARYAPDLPLSPRRRAGSGITCRSWTRAPHLCRWRGNHLQRDLRLESYGVGVGATMGDADGGQGGGAHEACNCRRRYCGPVSPLAPWGQPLATHPRPPTVETELAAAASAP